MDTIDLLSEADSRTNLYPCSAVLEPMDSGPRHEFEECRGASVAPLFERRLDTQLVTAQPGVCSTSLG